MCALIHRATGGFTLVMILRKVLVPFLACLILSFPVLAAGFDHSDWNRLLNEHVIAVRDGQATEVDYAAFAKNHQGLRDYLHALRQVEKHTFDQWPKEEQLAFLINAYNAWTVELILSGYPGIDSIKDLGSLFRSPWKKSFIPLLGEERSLDDIEHGLIRGSGRYNDPRIHFAVNCASIGCPALRTEAYRGDVLNQQLQEQAELFLSDRTRNRWQNGALKVSSIFKWYRSDFEKGWQGHTSLAAFLASFKGTLDLSDAQTASLKRGDSDIEFLEYDWRLNILRAPATR